MWFSVVHLACLRERVGHLRFYNLFTKQMLDSPPLF